MRNWRAYFLRVFPTIAVLGSWISLSFPEPGPLYAFRILGLLVLPFLVVKWKENPARANFPTKWLGILAAVTLFWGLLSQYWALDSSSAIGVTLSVTIAALSALSVLLAVQQTRRGRQLLSQGLTIALAVQLLLGAVQKLSGLSLQERIGNPWLYGTSLSGPFDNPNNYAVYLVGCAVPLISVLVNSPSVLRKGLAGIGLGGTAYFIMETESRAGISLLILCLAVVMLGKIFKKPLTLSYAFLAASAVVLVSISWFWKRSETLYNQYVYSGQLQSDQLRILLVQKGFDYVTATLGRGIGAGQFEEQLGKDGIAVTNAHNVFIEYMAEFGLPGTVILICSTLVLAGAWFRSGDTPAREKEGSLLGVGLAYCCVVVAAGLATSSSMEEPVWWVLICALVASSQSEPAAKANSEFSHLQGRTVESKQCEGKRVRGQL